MRLAAYLRPLARVEVWVGLGLLCPAGLWAQEVPAGTVLRVRLQQMVSSFGSDRDTRVAATLIAPVVIDGRVLLPLGAPVLGRIESVRRVGLGLSREQALVELTFDTIRLPDGDTLSIRATVAEVENAREIVDERGRIAGIRATATFASTLTGMAVSAGAFDPMLLGFTTGTSLSVFRIPESEVILPPGAELRLRLAEPVAVTAEYPSPLTGFGGADSGTDSATDSARMQAMVRQLPFRTATQAKNEPSDLTNLVLLGTRDAIVKAFAAAGWGLTDALSSRSTYATLRAIVENQGYREAPMSTLLLAGRAPVLTYAKTLNTFFKRHHLRVFGDLGTHDGLPIWTSSATHDSGIGFATRTKTFIHVIDQNIDEERDKVVYDLLLTGCVDAAGLVDRPWAPHDASNATGDALITDGRAAVLRFNACDEAKRADAIESAADPVRARPSKVARISRDTTLFLKNDLFRGNIFYQVYAGARMGTTALMGRKRPKPAERVVRHGGEEFKIVPGGEARHHELAPDDDPDFEGPSFYPVAQPRRSRESMMEFSVSGGRSGFGNDRFSSLTLGFPLSTGDEGALDLTTVNRLRPNAGFSIRTTLNTYARVSHEIGYTYNRTSLSTVFSGPSLESPSEAIAPAQIRQFHYNVLVHARPNGSWVRPYAAVGPALQLVRVHDDFVGSTSFVRSRFRDVALIVAAWDLGSKPPLEGGGIFQAAFQYGAGVKVHLSPHALIRLDFRETMSKQPDFWTKSFPTIRETGLEPGLHTGHGPLRHRLFTAGVGVAF